MLPSILQKRRGLEKVISQLASVQDSAVILVNPEIEDRGLQQKSNGTLEQANSVDAVLVKDEGNPIDDERGQVLQTAQVAMNMLDVTMTEMLVNMGIPWVIPGHSERRALLNESNEFVGDKVAYALSQGLKVIACSGETLEQRESGSTKDVAAAQTKAISVDWPSISSFSSSCC
ncbi:hypothetical protein LOK49_LG04G00703 [Camellia lanceoleosa]|uniref:Uncharacterized protein n=1 Tax=Camellia lanceoleosa TaxID=1840588 RepID=A0ACC0I3M6_9ERIC|nr:hypothetical protein LOK49_LG04G00703 [Camellia lanceoleosa]